MQFSLRYIVWSDVAGDSFKIISLYCVGNQDMFFQPNLFSLVNQIYKNMLKNQCINENYKV